MILSDRDIKKALTEGRLKIHPLPDMEAHLGPCSIDFRLNNTFSVMEHNKHAFIDPQDKESVNAVNRQITVEMGERFIVHPGELIIASTIEWFELPNDLIGRIEGRSSLGRLGIVVHSTAGRFDPGWTGQAVLELSNLGRMPVALYTGMRICSFTFEQLTSPVEISYKERRSSKYVDQSGPITSRLTEENFSINS